MSGSQGNVIAVDVEVREIVLGVSGGEAPTGRNGLAIVIEAYTGGIMQEKVGC